MRIAPAVAALALAGAPAFAQTSAPAGAYVNDPTHTSVEWRGKHQGLSTYSARFTKVSIELDFNEADISKSKVNATIEAKSIETDFLRTRPAADKRDFNEELIGDKAFNAAKFPTITFKSTKITKTGANTGTATGDLTFMGVTKPVTLNITYNGNRPDPRIQKHKVGFSATTTLKRSDFGMTFAAAAVADDIQVLIESELRQK